MCIVLTNDDGIFAPGIQALLKELQGLGKIFVAAPAMEQSATSQAITVHHPIRVDEYPLDGARRAWSIGGTPTDCVKLALETLMEVKPDFVVSGINAGMNLGNDVMYSGTVSAALEGALHNIPSIAVSFEAGPRSDFSSAAQVAKYLISDLLNKELPLATLLNINIPKNFTMSEDEIALTKLGCREYANTFEKRTDPRGRDYYWMGGQIIASNNEADTDIFAVENGKISITPIQFDLTNYEFIHWLKERKIRFYPQYNRHE